MKTKIVFLMLIACISILFISLSANSEDFTVKTIYFKPVGSEPLENDLAKTMLKAQIFFRDEMDRHGFEPKTFRLEKDDNGKVKIHIIHAKNPAIEYETHTRKKVRAELPRELKNPNSINVIFVGAIDHMRPVFGFNMAGMGWYYGTGGGVIIRANIIAENKKFVMKLNNWRPGAGRWFANNTDATVVHELGHAFGLYHNNITPKSVMAHESAPDERRLGVDLFLDELECRWLDKIYYFNENSIEVVMPRLTGTPFYKLVRNNGEEFVDFNISVLSRNSLHQAQFVVVKNSVLANHFHHLKWLTFEEDLEGKYPFISRIHFSIERELMGESGTINITALDIKGGYLTLEIKFREEDMEEDIPAAPINPHLVLPTKWAELKRK